MDWKHHRDCEPTGFFGNLYSINTLAENTKVLINTWELNMLLCESANLSWEAELCREGN